MLAPNSGLAPESALGSHPCVALSSARSRSVYVNTAELSAIQARYDARELFSTARGELLNFLHYWASVETDIRNTRGQLLQLTLAVEHFETLEIKIGELVLVGHPIKHEDSYVMQVQHPYFLVYRFIKR